ncbi:MAG: hypothetical protein QM764_23510 [Chitinophagaceae bacterium]
MRKLTFLLFFIIATLSVTAQKKAVTENGEEVILYDNGTWKPANDSATEHKAIPVNPTSFKKPVSSSFLLKSTKVNVGIWLDAKKWSFQKSTNNDAAEYELQLKGKDLYGMLISEKIEVPIETLKTIALNNARQVAPDVEVVKEEYRTVNNKKVLMLQMNGTTQGIKFSYYGYYYSSSKGTIQFLTYTAQNLLSSYKSDMEDLLNGFVVIE